jgi:hypothetical protein
VETNPFFAICGLYDVRNLRHHVKTRGENECLENILSCDTMKVFNKIEVPKKRIKTSQWWEENRIRKIVKKQEKGKTIHMYKVLD